MSRLSPEKASARAGWPSGNSSARMVVWLTRREMICCALGPAIGKCCFETDDDVPQAVEAWLGGDTADLFERRADGKTMVDLRAANKRRLVQLGVPAEQIDVSEECTFCSHEKYWSHRYTKGNRGSQAACIVLE